ncbi:MAX dimerization protein MGA a isoform X2 [Hippocampus zosterae]|uniref:MAX dimerization protein MGA a isoform X2 n=1 Tax=Hippocampus zosterae TaxID=109293 RepID=UPI00223DB79B|nr:MAX dimerization protein MGA a isoform X2 [Hippocampus zosterae]
MASKAQQEVMVFDDGRAASPAAAPDADYLPGHFGHAGRGLQGSNASKEAAMTGEVDMQSGPPCSKHAPGKPPRGDILTPESTCRGIQVTLDNNNMWNEFFRCKTEMILTKQGSRMFPYCRFRISGLQPSEKYVLMMDIQLVDQSRYTWTGSSWQMAGKAEHHVANSPFTHPESPATGHHWMRNPVSFYKLKLTGNAADQEGNVVLRPMHRYIPRFHVVRTDKAAKDIELNASNVATFAFQQTEFMAVTAYQNCRFAQLKVDCNPFAKGLREDGVGSRGLKLKSNQDGAAATGPQQAPKKSLKSLLANHKAPTCLDTKSSGVTCIQETSSGSAPRVVKNSTCNSQPAEQLIGDLIREAHISLTRCSVDSCGASKRLTETDTPTTAGKAASQDAHKADEKSPKSSRELPPAGTSEAAQGALVSEPKCQSEVQQTPSVKRPLPLPALALFLKKHSTKTKTAKSKLESCATTQVSAEVQTATRTALDIQTINASSGSKPENRDPTPSESDALSADVLRKEHISSPSSKETSPDPKPLATFDRVLVCSAPEPAKAVLANHKTRTCSTLTTSSLSPLLNSELDAADVPTALPSASKSSHFLPDSPCSPFGFESLSPVSSPEPLPSLSVTFAMDLDSGSSKPPESLPLSKESGPSVFQWHTVLPPAEPYVDPSFEVFQPASQSLSLGSPLLPSETPANDPSRSPVLMHSDSPTVDPLSFQESEQPLPFPGELSPLALPLALSPTFSSLDGGALSPTPSIADLVHFFSTEEHLGMGVEFPNADSPTPPCPADVSGEATASAPVAHVPTIPSPKQLKSKRKARRRQHAVSDLEPKTDDSAYVTMKPNLEEVEEQLFISFTSKEALKLHIAEPEEQEANNRLVSSPADVHPEHPTEDGPHEETIASFEEVLVKDMKMMKHQQIIHPVLQEVGLKMNLLDASLSIDLQYLGVRLPIPPPGVTVEPPGQELPALQGASGSFVSRTGKATDVTQIKGWREKFSPSESSEALSPPKAEVSVSSEQTKKNLSAFCSDMLDQYLESEAKLIDQRVASFSQPPADSLPVYELPTSSSSYVRTLGSVLKKQSAASPASDLISGFIPPSKRAKAPSRQNKPCRKVERKPKSSKSWALPGTAASFPPFPTLPDAPQTPTPLTEPPKPKQTPPAVCPMAGAPTPSPAQSPPPERRKRFKRKQSNPEAGAADLSGVLKPPMTRGLLRQKDLEDGAMWAGHPRVYITEERAAISLTSLFTLKGFVSDNPTAPIQLSRRPEPACLNDFCRLGCVCSSLAHTARVSHCGRPRCMLGCSCLKQKVVLLKNLDGSDSSPSSHGSGKRKKRKRMKMAYILKEAESVSQPAERIRTLWKRDSEDCELEATHVPQASAMSSRIASSGLSSKKAKARNDAGSCARVRRFVGKSGTAQRKPYRKPKRCKMKCGKKLPSLHPEGTPAEPPTSDTPTSGPPTSGPPTSGPPPNLPEETRASRRLTILTEGRWTCDEDRDHVLKMLCEAMAQDRLGKPFRALKYQVNPISQTVEDSGTIHYKVLISRQDGAQQGEQSQLSPEAEPVEAWQREVTEEDFLEDLPRELDENDAEEDALAHAWSQQADESRGGFRVPLPLLNGVSAAGFLSASKKRPGGGDPIQVNGKMYPLAKILLGEMGALHPANRLAAYLTGRVAPTRKRRVIPALPEARRMSSPCHELTYPTATSTSTTTSTPTAALASSATSASTAASTTTVGSTSAAISPAPDAPALSTAASTAAATPPVPALASGTSSSGPTLTCYLVPPPPPGPRVTPPRPSHSAVPTPSTVKMILRQVQSPTGVRYYRRPDGKLVQLIPISQLRAAAPNKTGSPGVLGAPSLAAPAGRLAGPVLPSPASALSGFKSFTVNRSLPVLADSSSLSRAYGSAPASRAPDHLPGGPSAPAPAKESVPVVPDFVISEVRSAQARSNLSNNPKDASAPTPGGAPAELGVSPAPTSLSGGPEPARDLADLDVVCIVDDEGDLRAPRRPVRTIDLLDSSSDETDHSSDLTDEFSDQERSRSVESKQVHNALERMRRHRMSLMVTKLKKELRLERSVSTAATLREAVQEIEALRASEKHLRREKMALSRKRKRLMAMLAPPAGELRPEEVAETMTPPNRRNRDLGLSALASPEPRPASPPSSEAALRRSTPSSGDDVVFVSCAQKPPKEQAPPPPTPVPLAPAPPSLRTAAVNQPKLATPTASPSPPVMRNRSKTVPNILSRCKSLPPVPAATGDPDGFRAILPAELLSVVGGAFPGQPFLTLTPLMTDYTPPPASSSATTVDAPNSSFPLTPAATPLPAPLPESPSPTSSSILPAVSPTVSRSASPLERQPAPKEEATGLNGHALAPPPLLHMKAGGGPADCPPPAQPPAPQTTPAAEGVSWRPMPRLVPLGLRGAPPT